MDGPRLTRFLRPYRRSLALTVGLILVDTALDLARPWPLKVAVDQAVNRRPARGWLSPLAHLSPTGTAVAAASAGVALVVVGALLGYVVRYTSSTVAERIGADLRESVFARLLELSVRFHDRNRTGELVTRLTDDVSRVQDALVAWFVTLLPELLTLVGMVVVMLMIDVPLAIVALLVTPVLAAVVVVRRKRIQRFQRLARDEEGLLAAQATDVIRNVRAVQAFGREPEVRRRFAAQNAAALGATIEAIGLEARYSPIADIVLAVGSAGVLLVGVLRVTSGRISLGLLLVVLSYLSSIYGPVRSLSRLARTMARAAASRERLDEILTAADEVPSGTRPVPPVRQGLALRDVSFSYRPDAPVLRRVSLFVAAAEAVCVVGSTGIGKSTLLSLVLRFHDPDAGRIDLDGVDLREFSLPELRRQVALVPQDPWVLDGTIADNIAFGRPDASPAEVRQAARTALVEDFAVSLPDGYDTVVGEGGVLLSGGQRRRVALARAILRDSSLLLLDEPTSGLDAASEAAVVEALRRASVGRTVVTVTHRLGLATLADRVVVLGRDGVVEQGTPELLLAGDGEFARLWRLQRGDLVDLVERR